MAYQTVKCRSCKEMFDVVTPGEIVRIHEGGGGLVDALNRNLTQVTKSCPECGKKWGFACKK